MARIVVWVEIEGRLVNRSDYAVRINPLDSEPVHFGYFNRIEIRTQVAIERIGVKGHIIKADYGNLTVANIGDDLLIISR